MTDEELTAIEARVTAISTAFSLDVEEALWESAQDVPALIAEVRSLRAERDALRKDAERLREAIDKFLSFQGSTREPEGQAALDAALAVQP